MAGRSFSFEKQWSVDGGGISLESQRDEKVGNDEE